MLIEQCSDRWEIPILLTFLIKSIMNKKLFSWKALAGLALLVAMGLTSCKQDNAVTLDEDGNYKVPEKPVTPTASGTNLKGFKTVAELNTLIAGTKDITDNIKAGGSVTINLDCSLLEAAAGDKIIIPGKTDAAINLVFTNKAKKNEGLVIADDALDQLTITFPDGEFGDVSFEMPYSTLTLASAGATTLGKTAFNVNKQDRSEFATTINSGITINAIKTWYLDDNDNYQQSGSILAKDGAKIVALVVDEDRAWLNNNEYGYDVPSVTTNLSNWKDVYVKDLIIVDNNLSVSANAIDDKIIVNKITIAAGDTATVWGGFANEIVGAGTGAVLTRLEGYADAATKYSNLTIEGRNRWYGTVKSAFESCTLNNFNDLRLTQGSASKLKFTLDDGNNMSLYFPVTAGANDASFKYSFSECEFAENVDIYAWGEGTNVIGKDGNPIKETLYAYNYRDYNTETGNWEWKYVDGIEKLTDIPDSIRMNTTTYRSDFWTYTYEPKVYEFSDLSIVPSFSKCKYNSKDVSDKNATDFVQFNSLTGKDGKDVATTTEVEIDGKLYKRIWTKTDGYILLEQ